MQTSDTMAVNSAGILIYMADRGKVFEIIGGKDGHLNLSMLL